MMDMARTRTQASAAWTNEDEHDPSRQDGPLALLRVVRSLLWRHKFALGLWVFFCWMASFLYTQTIPYSYTATATVLISPTRSAAAAIQADDAFGTLDMARIESELEVIRSERLLATVFEKLKLQSALASMPTEAPTALGNFIWGLMGSRQVEDTDSETARQNVFERFAEKIDVRRVGQSYVVSVSFTAGDPTLARRVANGIVSAYLWQSVAAKASLAQSGAEVLQQRITALSNQAEAAAAAIALGELPSVTISDADARIIGSALQPLEPSAPRRKLIVAFGVLLGIVSGLCVLAVAYAFDRKVRTPADLTRATKLPCLAAVPKVAAFGNLLGRKAFASAAVDNLETPFALAIRDMRTAVSINSSPQRHGQGASVALVAWHPRAGCTLLSHSLANFMQRGGKPTTLIEANMRGASGQAAQSREKTGSATTLSDALMSTGGSDTVRYLDEKGVAFLPATSGNIQANYFADLTSPRMAQLIDHAQARGELVLDLPALSQSADAKALAKQADAVVIVATAGRTTIEELHQAVQALREVRANVIGTVLNRA